MSDTWKIHRTNMSLVKEYIAKAIYSDIEWFQKKSENKIVTTSFYCEELSFIVIMNEEYGYSTEIVLLKRTEDNPMGEVYHPKGEGMEGDTTKDLKKFAKIFFAHIPLAI